MTVERHDTGDQSAAVAIRTPRRSPCAPRAADEAEVWGALVIGLRDYVAQERLPHRCVLGMSGGIDSAVVAAHRRRRDRRRPVHGGVAAQRVLLRALPLRRRRPRRADRRALPRGADRADGRRVRRRAGADRPGRGERAGPRARHDADGAVERRGAPRPRYRATRASWPSATRRSTATRSAASPRSRTFRRRWSGGWRGGATPRRRVAASSRRSRRTRSASRRRPSCAPASSTPTRCPTTTCSTRSWRATSTATRACADIVAAGFDAAEVARIARLVDRAEWKRRQYPPGPKISFKAFGRDRRLPITNRWREVTD